MSKTRINKTKLPKSMVKKPKQQKISSPSKQAEKIKVKEVQILWKEGLTEELKQYPKSFKTIKEANKQILENSKTAPKGGAYDKHGFKIIWTDGNEYEGRMDVKHTSEPNNDLDIGTHVRGFAEDIIKSDFKWVTAKDKKGAKELLDRYELNGKPAPAPLPVKTEQKEIVNKKQKLLDIMAQSTGTTQYHNLSITPIKSTDGIKDMAEELGAYWLVDAIGSYQITPKIRAIPFQLWELNVKDSKAVLTMREETNAPIKVKQEIPYTDFPEGSWKFYAVDGVLMQRGEY